jgi:predicted house-cleaning noncanonical NTP pyrophosphatase (MazG superfamily)
MKKLIRDNYQTIINPKKLKKANSQELREFVLNKIVEESNEVLENLNNQENPLEELADLLEILEFFGVKFCSQKIIVVEQKNNLKPKILINEIIKQAQKIKNSNVNNLNNFQNLFSKLVSSLEINLKDIFLVKKEKESTKGGFDLGLILTLD